MLLLCVLVLKVTVEKLDAKLIYFSLRVSLSFCLKAVSFFFLLYGSIV